MEVVSADHHESGVIGQYHIYDYYQYHTHTIYQWYQSTIVNCKYSIRPVLQV
jgi:hypothetical protein